MRWGLVPHWAEDARIGYKLTNARSETIEDKPLFRDAFRHRRCLIPTTGFYTWDTSKEPHVPYFMALADGTPFALAGLWEEWRDSEGHELLTCIIVTTRANKLIRPIHDRMPVILNPESYDSWLDTEHDNRETLKSLFSPYPARKMIVYRVSDRVNNAAHQGPEPIEKLEGENRA